MTVQEFIDTKFSRPLGAQPSAQGIDGSVNSNNYAAFYNDTGERVIGAVRFLDDELDEAMLFDENVIDDATLRVRLSTDPDTVYSVI